MHRPSVTPLPVRILFVAVALATCLGLGVHPSPAQGEAYKWSFQWKKGDTERFRTYIKISGRAADDTGDLVIALRSESRHEVRDVAADGTVTYDQSDDSRQTSINGMPIPDKPSMRKPITITVAPNGLMVKRVNPAADPFDRSEKSVPVIQSIPAPDQPVKIGDTWKSEFPNPLLKNKTVVATSTLIGAEKLLGVDALKVRMEMSFPSTFGATEAEIVHVQVTYHLDPKSGQLLRGVYLVRNPMLPIPGKNMEARVFVSRIVPGQNDKDDPDGEKLLLPVKK